MLKEDKQLSEFCIQLKHLIELQRDLLLTDDNVNSELVCIQMLEFTLINDVIGLLK